MKKKLEDNLETLRGYMPPKCSISAEELVNSVILACRQNPKLLEADQASLMAAAFKAAKIGLDCSGGTLGHGALVPRWSGRDKKTIVEFTPMYRGLISLVCRYGDVRKIWAEVVYEGEKFRVLAGTDARIEHEQSMFRTSKEFGDANIIAAYAVAETTDGVKHHVVMSRGEIEKIREKCSHPKSDVWRDWYSEQCKKTAIRRLIKLLPMSASERPLIHAVATVDHFEGAVRREVPKQITSDIADDLLTDEQQDDDLVDAEYEAVDGEEEQAEGA